MREPNECIQKGTSGASTDGGGAVPDPLQSSLPWYVLWVNSRAEKSVRDALIGKGFQAFVATRKEVHKWRRGERRKVERVLIPSIVFVRMDKSDRKTIEDCQGVCSIMSDPARKKSGVSSWDTLARVSPEEMLFFQQMLTQEGAPVNFAPSDLVVGDYVRIKDFDEAHSKAQIVRIYGDNKTYVGLRVSFLGCAYMQVPLNRIDKL